MAPLDVDQIAGVIGHLEGHPVTLHTGFCARQRHRLSTCTRCIDACPVGALAWNEGLEIDGEVCTGCGVCASVCPTGAIEAHSPSNADLLVQVQRAARAQEWVAFACPQSQMSSGDGAQTVTVPCLGRLDESILVGAAAYGARPVWLMEDACAGCPRESGRAVAGAVQRRSNELLAAFGLQASITFRRDLPAKQGRSGEVGQGVSRRGLLKKLVQETVRLGDVAGDLAHSQSTQPGLPARKNELPAEVPEKRLQLLAALKGLGQPVEPILRGDGEGLFARFTLGASCTGCQMCAFFCPTGALVNVQQDGKVGLAFTSSRCTACGLCRDICYRDAAILDGVVDLDDVLALSVDWLFAQHMEAAPWAKPPDQRVAQRMLDLLQH